MNRLTNKLFLMKSIDLFWRMIGITNEMYVLPRKRWNNIKRGKPLCNFNVQECKIVESKAY